MSDPLRVTGMTGGEMTPDATEITIDLKTSDGQTVSLLFQRDALENFLRHATGLIAMALPKDKPPGETVVAKAIKATGVRVSQTQDRQDVVIAFETHGALDFQFAFPAEFARPVAQRLDEIGKRSEGAPKPTEH